MRIELNDMPQRRCRTRDSVVHWTDADADGRVYRGSALGHDPVEDYPWESGHHSAVPGAQGRVVRLVHFSPPGSGNAVYRVVPQ